MRCAHRLFHPLAATIVATLLAGMLGACADQQRKEAEEAAKNTFACQLDGQRLVMKFEMGEARLLLPDGDRVILYQVPMGSGIRYTNGNLDLRGKGMDLQLIRNGNPSPLVGCEPYISPK
jgi:membrane-bound inhibitor of C-type lysozyme